ncbi:MAG TPA: xanthine dehydrogenase family protein subunit M [Myxococcales bacterium]|jgi:CO/xanthine dehydrogenase FAD-binding subunit|nr:xanthine dehydrogenase family protein subunit M [Myxococcales bacterium]
MAVEIDLAESLDHALELLGAGDPEVRPVAGATDVVLRLHIGKLKARKLVSIADVPELSFIQSDQRGIRFGAGTLLSDLLAHPDFCQQYGCAAESLRQFASPQIRNRATVGGNVGNASPAADMVPPLIALEAQVTLLSKARGLRTLPLEEVFLGLGKTAIAPDELILEIAVPRRASWFQAFAKFGSRSANVIAVINMAMALDLDGATVRRARVAYGSVAPKTLRAAAVEQFLSGRELSADTIRGVAEVVQSAISPIDDVRGSARYKRRLAVNATQDALAAALRQVKR